jgi:recombination protein RecA
MRLDIRRIENLKENQEIIGGRVRVKVVKNKMAPPFRQAEFDILFNLGVSREGEIVDLGVEKGIIEKAGAWYSYGGNRIGQGRENVKEYLRNNVPVAKELEEKIIESVNLKK